MFKLLNNGIELFKSYLVILISISVSPVIISILAVTIIYRSLIYLVLKYQNGDSFKGIMEGWERLWDLKCNSKNVIQFIHFVQTDNIDEVIIQLKIQFSNIIKNPKFVKLVYSRSKSYGYTFWKHDKDVVLDDFIKCIKFTDKSGIEKEDLKKFSSEYSDKELPRNHTLSFELIIIKNPIIQNDNKTEQYALLYRFHHALADGDSAKRFFTAFYKTKQNIINNIPSNMNYFIKLKKWIVAQLYVKILPIFISIQYLLNELIFYKRDKHILYGPKLSGIKITRWKTEEDILNVVKTIKRNVRSVTFSMIFYTALSNSLSQYFMKKSKSIPSTVEFLYPSNINKLLPVKLIETGKINETAFKNEYTLELLKLPILCDGENTNILQRLYKIRDTVTQIEYWFLLCINWMSVSLKYLPEGLAQLLVDNVLYPEVAVSNYVDNPAGYAIDKYSVTDSVLLVQNFGLQGISFTCFNYKNDILNFGVTVDTSLISNEEEVDDIIDNIILSLKNLNKEIEYHKMQKLIK